MDGSCSEVVFSSLRVRVGWRQSPSLRQQPAPVARNLGRERFASPLLCSSYVRSTSQSSAKFTFCSLRPTCDHCAPGLLTFRRHRRSFFSTRSRHPVPIYAHMFSVVGGVTDS